VMVPWIQDFEAGEQINGCESQSLSGVHFWRLCVGETFQETGSGTEEAESEHFAVIGKGHVRVNAWLGPAMSLPTLVVIARVIFF